jgi:hypothetical protein
MPGICLVLTLRNLVPAPIAHAGQGVECSAWRSHSKSAWR